MPSNLIAALEQEVTLLRERQPQTPQIVADIATLEAAIAALQRGAVVTSGG